MLDDIRSHHAEDEPGAVEAFLARSEASDVATREDLLRDMKAQSSADRLLIKRERRGLRRVHRVELVKPNLLLRIAAAWIITVPVVALLAAIFFFMIPGMLLP